jgi:uncharacterized membrane protein (UPF0127 family)
MKEAEVIFYPEGPKAVKLRCEIADTIPKKINGLMNRKNLEKDQGMLFTFLIPWQRFFWMKNVKIPLDIIFVNRKNKIIKIYEAPVEKGVFHKMYSSHGFCKYVIESNIRFCRQNNIKVKDMVKIKK